MKLPQLRKTRVVHDAEQQAISKLIVYWEKKIKPDLLREVQAFDEQERPKISAFLDRVESRVMAHLVMEITGKDPATLKIEDKKPPQTQVTKV